jgi:hypothetical protein
MGKFNSADSGYKCFIEGSKVNTPYGKFEIEKLSSGNRVINAFNEQDEIINKFEYDYNGEINNIILDNDKTISAIDGHFILIQRERNLYWETIENIKDTDLLVELEENDSVEELKKIIPQYSVVKY